MIRGDFVFTSESVSEGHPDKVADQISDAILDKCLASEPKSRVALETLVKDNNVVLAGEITTKADIDYNAIVREVGAAIGYTDPTIGFDTRTVNIHTFISKQSPDISMGVDSSESKEQGAGDQGLMFGFACDETPEYMPLPISLAHKLMLELSRIRHAKEVSFLKPDAKAQVSVEYKNWEPVAVKTVVISTQHSDSESLKDLEEFVREKVIKKVIPANLLSKDVKYLVNPTGRFVIGGPVGDCGLTGRKIIVDTYGGYARHGGGAFSGKDPSKVDRSGAYAMRHIAKNLVAAGLARKCEVQVAYAIGVARPVSVFVDTFGTGKIDERRIADIVSETFDLRPRGIIESLQLLKPIYRKTAAYGHFGREPGADGEFSWEKLDKVAQIKEMAK